nr:hypothetical protein CFP56_34643 [Quercus suber]
MAETEAPIQEVVLQILGRNSLVVQNHFSPLSDLGFGVDDEFVEGEDHEVEQRSNYLQRLVDSVGEFQTISGLHLPSWETNEVFGQSYGSGEKDISVLKCDPLSRWEPNELRDLECLKVIDVGVPKRPANSRSRGLRELKGLISNVNYDGVSSRSKSNVSSTVVGVVGSCK